MKTQATREDVLLAELDCFHRYYRLCLADGEDPDSTSRFEAWLDYKLAILRRDRHHCQICGQVRPPVELDIRPRRQVPGPERLAPDNLACVCAFCDGSVGQVFRGRWKLGLA